jgi:D-3-phosphoglycerate dehydrogenase
VIRVVTLNNIAKVGLDQLPGDRYAVTTDAGAADADVILVRSASMHGKPIPPSLRAVGRAGAGVNNIPIAEFSARGIPVFNTPGANANAVKELVVAGLILACRNICQAWDFARKLDGTDEELNKAVEAGKKAFAGIELPGRTLSVIGLGAIGRLVANAGVNLGMQVVGFDPGLTVEGAWQLSSSVARARGLEEALAAGDFVTVHVPLSPATKGLVNAERLAKMKAGVAVLNFAREGIVDEAAMVAALDAGCARAYISDFPTSLTKNHPKCVTLPHLGASTEEAEDNCAVQVAAEVRDYLENGNIRNAVNFPEVSAPRHTDHRLVAVHDNVPNMLAKISETLGAAGVNIHDMINSSRGDLAYTLVDLDNPVPDDVFAKINAIPGVRRADRLPRPS